MLPLPSTTNIADHASGRLGLSKRALKFLFAAVLAVTFFGIFTYQPFSISSELSSPGTIDLSSLERILEEHASSHVVGAEHKLPQHDSSSVGDGDEHQPLSELGFDADESFRLGTLSKPEYRAELEDFVNTGFPAKYKTDALDSLERTLGDSGADTKFPSIPHKIWQTAKNENPNTFHNWQDQVGFDYTFMNDADSDAWMKKNFDGSKILWTWQHLPSGILQARSLARAADAARSDYLRYIVVCFEGGIYSDTDTLLLRDFSNWGTTDPDERIKGNGPASLIVGIEADVGGREDWHSWWPRPLQIAQWTLAGAPFQPALIDVLRKIYLRCADIEDWKKKEGLTGAAGDQRIRDAIMNDEVVGSVMEWTGPGVFTDGIIRYLRVQFGVKWPDLKDRRKPTRWREAVVLPVTGFAPGIGMFNAGGTNDPQAMVQHWFYGSWKHGT
ncbi:hypothetical protein DL93DRAFT_2172122 [Clavulina sp. PMI_390]|nr:hypothetical protein DL93DRAFT_2172122 [Clavulina sp. PMI_390]